MDDWSASRWRRLLKSKWTKRGMLSEKRQRRDGDETLETFGSAKREGNPLGRVQFGSRGSRSEFVLPRGAAGGGFLRAATQTGNVFSLIRLLRSLRVTDEHIEIQTWSDVWTWEDTSELNVFLLVNHTSWMWSEISAGFNSLEFFKICLLYNFACCNLTEGTDILFWQ